MTRALPRKIWTLQSIKDFVTSNWKNADKLQSLIGDNLSQSATWCFGQIPTDKASVTVVNGKIVKVETWSGLNWSARGGRGSATVTVQ